MLKIMKNMTVAGTHRFPSAVTGAARILRVGFRSSELSVSLAYLGFSPNKKPASSHQVFTKYQSTRVGRTVNARSTVGIHSKVGNAAVRTPRKRHT